MHKVKRTCPICRQNGKDRPLELRQINLTEAVYICEDRNCIYPIGFQWEYVKNNILDESDESSDDCIKSTTNSSNSPQIITNSSCHNSNKLVNEKHKNTTNKQSINKTSDSKENLIISNLVIKNSEHIQSINKKENVELNKILTKSAESVRKNNVRNNKTKVQHISGALPESVVKNAKALSEYFSSTTNQSKKSKTTIKSVFDIIQQPTVKKQDVSTKIKKSEEEILSDEANDLIIRNTLIEHDYSLKEDNIHEVFENATNEQEKLNEITDSFDDILFSNEDKCDTKTQSLDLSEMDELLSFL